MTVAGLTYAALLGGAVGLDALVRPRNRGRARAGLREWPGLLLLACMATALFGAFLAICGNAAVAMALALAVQALPAVASNAKYAMLGEPLLFSDLALVGAIFRHPQFYLSAVAIWQRVAAGLVATALLGVLVWLSVADLGAHLAGLAFMAGGLAALALSLRLPALRRAAATPDAEEDTRRLGLLAALLLYWLRWRESRDPPPCAAQIRHTPGDAPELVVMIQCESFADPVELFGDPALLLPGLA
ncbi:MAG TPA: LTA synthase family protein, partial [Novosphingobium sp.]|nr:LTA synthase family protein [Novosphingobium sp.]